MAEVAQQHGLDVELGTFEEWDAAGRRFDLLTAGQAWHWVDPVKGAAKAATVLRPGGRIGLFWNHGHPSAEMQRRFDTVYTRHAPELLTNSTTTGSMAHNPLTDLVNSLHVAGFHDSGTTFTFGHDREYTTREWLDLAPTHSDHAQLAPDRLRALLDALGTEIDRAGGRFVVHYDTALLTARLPPQARRG